MLKSIKKTSVHIIKFEKSYLKFNLVENGKFQFNLEFSFYKRCKFYGKRQNFNGKYSRQCA